MTPIFWLPLMAVTLLAASLASAPARAETAIASFTQGTIFPGFSTDETVGYSFSVAAGPGVTVSSLGWWDQTPDTPLAASHQVGIWTSSGLLLASVTVPTNGALTGSFRYASLDVPLVLAGGSSYVVGGRDLTSDGDSYVTTNTNLVMGTGISFGLAARSPNTSGFAFPDTLTASSGGRFGPNFVYAPVPEASTFLLMALGLGSVALVRRRAR